MTRGGWRRVGVLSILALLGAAHLQVRGGGLGYSGPLLVLDHLYNIVLAGALLAICFAVGDRLLEARGPQALARLDRLVLSVLVGSGLLSVVFLGLGLAGLLSPVSLALVLLATGWLARGGLARMPGVLSRSLSGVPRTVLGVTAALGLVLLSAAVLPPIDWDSLMYHLEVPAQFLEQGRVHLPPDNLHVAFVGLVHMLYLPLLAFGGSSAPAVLSLGLALLLPLVVWRFARCVFGETAAELSGLVVWGTPTLVIVAITPRVDVTLAVFLLTGHYALYRAVESEGGSRWLVLGGLLVGLALGVKYQAGAYALALAPLVLWGTIRGEGSGVGHRPVLAAAGAAVLAALPWLLKNWILLGSPLYPLFAERLLPPWLAEFYGTSVVPGFVDGDIFGILGQAREPFNLADAFFHPGRLSPEMEAEHFHLSPLLLLLPLWFVWRRDRGLAWLILPGLGFVAVLLGWSLRTNLRYLVPAVPPLTIAASALVVRSVETVVGRVTGSSGEQAASPAGASQSPGRTDLRRKTRIGLVAAGVLALLPTALALQSWLPRIVSPGHLAGEESRLGYLSEMHLPGPVLYAGLTDFGDRPVPEDARVLMLFEARGHFSPVPVIQDNFVTNWPLIAELRKQSERDLGCLRSMGVSHVLVGRGPARFYLQRGVDPGTLRWPAFRQFRERCLKPVFATGGYGLYRAGGGSDATER